MGLLLKFCVVTLTRHVSCRQRNNHMEICYQCTETKCAFLQMRRFKEEKKKKKKKCQRIVAMFNETTRFSNIINSLIWENIGTVHEHHFILVSPSARCR